MEHPLGEFQMLISVAKHNSDAIGMGVRESLSTKLPPSRKTDVS
jgi:hypothetical protein